MDDPARHGCRDLDLPPVRLATSPAAQHDHGLARFPLLNGGVVLVAVGIATAGRFAEIGAAASFAAHLWGRVSPAGLSEL